MKFIICVSLLVCSLALFAEAKAPATQEECFKNCGLVGHGGIEVNCAKTCLNLPFAYKPVTKEDCISKCTAYTPLIASSCFQSCGSLIGLN